MVISDQKISPPRITCFRRKRSPTIPANGAAAAYTHMNEDATYPNCTSLRCISALSSGNTEKIACRSA